MIEWWADWVELLGFDVPADLQLHEREDGSVVLWRSRLPAGVALRPELRARAQALHRLRGSELTRGMLDDTTFQLADLLARRGLLLPRLALDLHKAPEVTVVVPVRDRALELGRLVRSLEEQTYPSERVELVIVDDGSRDESVRRLAEGRGARYVRVDGSRGPAAARNRGAAVAAGSIVAFVDSDCVARPDWLERHVAMLGEPGVLGAAGRVLPLSIDGWLGRYEVTQSSLDRGECAFDVDPQSPVPWVPSCNLVVARDAFVASGGFDEDRRLGEDVDLCARLVEHGRLRYSAAAAVEHDHRTTLGPFLRRRFEYGSSEVSLALAHPTHRRCLRLLPLPTVTLIGLALGLANRDARAAAVAALAVAAELASRPPRVVASRHANAALTLVALGAGHAVPLVVAAAALRSSRLAALAGALLLASGLRASSGRRGPLAAFLVAHALAEVAYGAGRWTGAFRSGHPLHVLERITVSPAFPRRSLFCPAEAAGRGASRGG